MTHERHCYDHTLSKIRLHPRFSTGSERLVVISKLRETGKVPPSFPAVYEKEKEIIEWMLNEDPEKRPTAEQLLGSEYMPISTTEEKLSILFNRKEKDLSISNEFNLAKVYNREKAILTLQSIFHLHAAVQFDVEIYFPNSDQLDGMIQEKDSYPVMFKSGKLMNIAKDGAITLARYLARLPNDREIKFLKRYSFQNVVKQSDKSGFTMSQVCSVDIVGSRFGLITDAEIIKILSRIAKVFVPKHGRWVLRINHTGVIYSILDYCGVPKREYEELCRFVSKRKKCNYTWNQPVPEGKPILKDLFRLRGAVDVTRQKLANIFTNIGAREALNDISTLLNNISIWGIDKSNVKIEFDTSLTNDYQRYSGVIFQFGIQKGDDYIAIMNGGRYDKMVTHFTLFDKTPQYVVGANIKLEKLFRHTLLVDTKQTTELTTSEEEEPIIPHFDSGVPQVLVYSENKGIKEERMRVADMLWEAGIKTDLTYDDNTDYEYVKTYCKQHKVKYIVVTKSNLISKNLVRIRLSTNQDSESGIKKAKVYEIDKKNLVAYITSEGKQKKPTTPSASSSTIQPSSPLDTIPENHVVFLQPKNKAKHQSTASIAVKKCSQQVKSLLEDSVVLISLTLTSQDVKKIANTTHRPPSGGTTEADILAKYVKDHDTNIFIYTSKDDKVTTILKK